MVSDVNLHPYTAEDELMMVYCPGWASSPVWDWSGVDDDIPLYSPLLVRRCRLTSG